MAENISILLLVGVRSRGLVFVQILVLAQKLWHLIPLIKVFIEGHDQLI